MPFRFLQTTNDDVCICVFVYHFAAFNCNSDDDDARDDVGRDDDARR